MTPGGTFHHNKQDRLPPSRAWYLVALFLFFLFGIGSVVYFVISLFTMFQAGTRFVVPGELVFDAKEPGGYTLYSEPSVLYKGRMYPGSSELPDDITIDIAELATGKNIPLEPSLHGKETVGSQVRYPVASFTADSPGRYGITVSGDFPERIFLVRRSVCKEIVTVFVVMVVSLMIGWIGAPIMAIIVFAKRSAARKRPVAMTREGQPEDGPDEQKHTTTSESSVETWATFCHLGSFAGYIFPLGNIFVPLVLWLVKKDESEFVDDQGKESVNFQISMLIYYIVSALLSCIVIGLFMLAGLTVFNIIVVILASVRANRGERFRYPLCIRFIR